MSESAGREHNLRTCKKCSAEKHISEFEQFRWECRHCRGIKREKNRAARYRYQKQPRSEHRKKYHAEYMAEYRTSPEEKIKGAARQKLIAAVASGQIVRPSTCSRCEATAKIHGHHSDYSKPLDVIWLCPSCHGAEHRRLNQEIQA